MKNSIIAAVFFINLLILVGCSSIPKADPQTQIMTPVYVTGTNVTEMRMDDVRNPENVEVYTVGRYVDPNNSSIMYEKNELYRLANSSSWNTRPNPPIKLSDGSNLINSQVSNTANVKPLYAEMEKRIIDYKNAVSKNNQAYAEMISKGAEDINKSAQKMNTLIKQNEALIKSQTDLNKKIRKQAEVTNDLKKLIDSKSTKNKIDKISPISVTKR